MGAPQLRQSPSPGLAVSRPSMAPATRPAFTRLPAASSSPLIAPDPDERRRLDQAFAPLRDGGWVRTSPSMRGRKRISVRETAQGSVLGAAAGGAFLASA